MAKTVKLIKTDWAGKPRHEYSIYSALRDNIDTYYEYGGELEKMKRAIDCLIDYQASITQRLVDKGIFNEDDLEVLLKMDKAVIENE